MATCHGIFLMYSLPTVCNVSALATLRLCTCKMCAWHVACVKETKGGRKGMKKLNSSLHFCPQLARRAPAKEASVKSPENVLVTLTTVGTMIPEKCTGRISLLCMLFFFVQTSLLILGLYTQSEGKISVRCPTQRQTPGPEYLVGAG